LNESEIFDDWIIKTKNNKQDSTLKRQDNTLKKQDSTLKPYKFIANEPHNKKRKLEKKKTKQYMKSTSVTPSSLALSKV
jgi:hypothetical protein